RLALVGDADRGNLRRGDIVFAQDAARDGELLLPDLAGVVFDPAGLRIILAMLFLRRGADLAAPIEEKRARARRSLVEREDVVGVHQQFPESPLATWLAAPIIKASRARFAEVSSRRRAHRFRI